MYDAPDVLSLIDRCSWRALIIMAAQKTLIPILQRSAGRLCRRPDASNDPEKHSCMYIYTSIMKMARSEDAVNAGNPSILLNIRQG
jgi:hypothetical protein